MKIFNLSSHVREESRCREERRSKKELEMGEKVGERLEWGSWSPLEAIQFRIWFVNFFTSNKLNEPQFFFNHHFVVGFFNLRKRYSDKISCPHLLSSLTFFFPSSLGNQSSFLNTIKSWTLTHFFLLLFTYFLSFLLQILIA